MRQIRSNDHEHSGKHETDHRRLAASQGKIGYPILRLTFLPRILAALMVLAGLGWLIFLSLPPANDLVSYLEGLGFLAEALLMLWLLVQGIANQRS